jgi:hypothetical protein
MHGQTPGVSLEDRFANLWRQHPRCPLMAGRTHSAPARPVPSNDRSRKGTGNLIVEVPQCRALPTLHRVTDTSHVSAADDRPIAALTIAVKRPPNPDTPDVCRFTGVHRFQVLESRRHRCHTSVVGPPFRRLVCGLSHQSRSSLAGSVSVQLRAHALNRSQRCQRPLCDRLTAFIHQPLEQGDALFLRMRCPIAEALPGSRLSRKLPRLA